jgi:hypothetical protein
MVESSGRRLSKRLRLGFADGTGDSGAFRNVGARGPGGDGAVDSALVE